jgi:hypothetical protein
LRVGGRGIVWPALPSWRGVTKLAASRGPVETDAKEGESPVGESRPVSCDDTRVPRDTRNPGGISADHSVRLNTFGDR